MREKSRILWMAMFVLGFTWMPAAEADDTAPYIVMTLQNRQQVKLEYDEFVFPWVSTDIQDEFDCEKIVHFEMADVVKVIVVGEMWNSCKHRDEWVFDIRFKEGRDSLIGFIETRPAKVAAREFGSGRNAGPDGVQSVPRECLYDLIEVDRIVFNRGQE